MSRRTDPYWLAGVKKCGCVGAVLRLANDTPSSAVRDFERDMMNSNRIVVLLPRSEALRKLYQECVHL